MKNPLNEVFSEGNGNGLCAVRGIYLAEYGQFVVFVRRNIRLAPISVHGANRTFVWVHAERRERIEQSFGIDATFEAGMTGFGNGVCA